MAIHEQSLPYIRAISPYQPGKPITQLAREMGLAVEQIVKLASNENPLGMSPKARRRLKRRSAGWRATRTISPEAGAGRTHRPGGGTSCSATARTTCSI
jgi:hypothetical protein